MKRLICSKLFFLCATTLIVFSALIVSCSTTPPVTVTSNLRLIQGANGTITIRDAVARDVSQPLSQLALAPGPKQSDEDEEEEERERAKTFPKNALAPQRGP